MPEIDFTQFLFPRGRAIDVKIDRPEPVYQKARQIIAAGLRFECEIDGSEARFTITDEDEGDLAIEVCQNGPDVPGAVDKLILGFNLEESTNA